MPSGSATGVMRGIGSILFLGAAYAGAAQFAWMIGVTAVPAFFPAAGLTLASLILMRRRWWAPLLVTVFAVEVALDLSHALPATTSLLLGAANVVEPLLTAVLITMFARGPIALRSVRDLFVWGSASAVGVAVAGVIGTAALAPVVGPDQEWSVWFGWWTGDILGQLVFAPLVLSFTRLTAPVPVSRALLRQTAVAAPLAIAAAALTYVMEPLATPFVGASALAYTGMTWGIRGTTRLGFAVAMTMTLAEATSHGLFDAAGLNDLTGRSLSQTFLLVSIGGAQLLAAEVHRRRDVEAWLRERETQLAREAGHDSLTGLANRSLIVTTLARTLDGAWPHRQVGLLFCDLDRFKLVNDTLGHEAGDRVLQEAARRLMASTPPGCTVGRLGGDEFVVIVAESGPGTASTLAHRVAAALAEPFEVAGHTLSTSGSVGMALSGGPDVKADELLREGDRAMYLAKQSGARGAAARNRVAVRVGNGDRRAIENALREAVDREALVVHYQPVLRLAGSQIAGVEALVRWRRDGRLIPAAAFIGSAEELDVLRRLGRWVTTAVCEQIAAWDADLGDLAPPWVALNFSCGELVGSELDDTALPDHLLDATEATGISPRRLMVEISGVNGLPAGAIAAVIRLRQAGVRVALDAFGAAPLGLSVLSTMPVDLLKVDMQFIAAAGPDPSHSVLAGIVELGRTVGVQVAVEGVETDEQLATVRSLVAQYAQGYGICQPKSAGDLAAWLRERASISALTSVAVPAPRGGSDLAGLRAPGGRESLR